MSFDPGVGFPAPMSVKVTWARADQDMAATRRARNRPARRQEEEREQIKVGEGISDELRGLNPRQWFTIETSFVGIMYVVSDISMETAILKMPPPNTSRKRTLRNFNRECVLEAVVV